MAKRISSFTKEFRKTLSTAIVAAFGFVTALTWNSVIQELVNEISSFSPLQGKLMSAIIVTIISVLVIIFVTNFVKEK